MGKIEEWCNGLLNGYMYTIIHRANRDFIALFAAFRKYSGGVKSRYTLRARDVWLINIRQWKISRLYGHTHLILIVSNTQLLRKLLALCLKRCTMLYVQVRYIPVIIIIAIARRYRIVRYMYYMCRIKRDLFLSFSFTLPRISSIAAIMKEVFATTSRKIN